MFYSVYLNAIKLLEYRGYRLDHEQLTESAYTTEMVDKKFVLMHGIRDPPEESKTEDRLTIALFPVTTDRHKKQYREPFVKKYVKNHMIFVFGSRKTTAKMRDHVMASKLGFRTEFVSGDSLLLEYPKHVYFKHSKFEIVDPSHLDKTIDPSTFAVRTVDDCMVFWLGGQAGDIIKELRPSPVCGEEIMYYRVQLFA